MSSNSGIRKWLLEILTAINEPVTAEDIKTRVEINRGVDAIRMALKALKRDNLVREWQPGYFVLKDYEAGEKCDLHIAKIPAKSTKNSKPPHVGNLDRGRIAKPRANNIKQKRLIQNQSDESMVEKSDLNKKLDKQLDDLDKVVNSEPPMVEDYELKMHVLKRLRDIMAEDICDVLDRVIADYMVLGEGASRSAH